MLLFLFVGVAESWLANNDFRNLREMVFENAAPGTFTPEDVQVYLDAFARDGALTAALNYYRANMPAAAWLREPPQLPEITTPTMVIWGEADAYPRAGACWTARSRRSAGRCGWSGLPGSATGCSRRRRTR